MTDPLAFGAAEPRRHRVLVIGFGNTLRGDDAVGCLIADEIARRAVPGVRALAVPQLAPELAAEMAVVETVIFVDAGAPGIATKVRVDPVGSRGDVPAPAMAHAFTPALVLGICQTLYQKRPETWLVTVPALDFALGEGLSPAAELGMREATEAIRALIEKSGHDEPDAAKACPGDQPVPPWSPHSPFP